MPKEGLKETLKFKPNKWSYIFFGGFGFSFLILVLFILIIIFFFSGFNIYVLYSIIVDIILTLLLYFLVTICYKKEEYTITDNKIIYNHGNIFSDNTVEINLDKIVQVHTVLGFIQNLVFKTGTILIMTAGSSTSRLILRNIDVPMDFYEIIQEKMRVNGFHLKKDKLVQTAKPHWLGVFLEVFSKSFGIILLLLIFGGQFLFDPKIYMSPIGQFGIFFGGLAFIGIIILMLIFGYLDLQRRKYDIFTDSVFYTEGFLTKNYSFLPMESVSDTENRQGFVSKIFGLHDVIVSSEGANNKVIFKNMTEGEQMMKNIKFLKNSIIRKENESHAEEQVEEELVGYKDKLEKPLDYDKSFKAEYKISMLKAMIVLIPFFIFPPLWPILIILVIMQVIRVSFTKFIVTESSVEYRYEFLTNKHNSFSIEKITGVVIKESFVDKWIGTCTIKFWSIGSSSNITFYGIKKDENLEEKILAKVGIKKDEKYSDIDTKFNLGNFFKASIGVTIFIGFLILSNIALLFVAPKNAFIALVGCLIFYSVIFFLLYLYKTIFYGKKWYIQRIHTNFIESISGIFFVSKYYSLFRNIKGLHSTKYPFTNTGTFLLDVAGEQLVQQGNNQPPQMMSNSIKIPYIENVYSVQEEIDTILNEEKLDKTLLKTSKQDVGNSIFWLIIFGLICGVPLLGLHIAAFIGSTLVFLLIILWVVWFIKVKYFNFEKNRVIYSSGIIYKSKHSILYERINFIEKNQGMTNKIFKNGSVSIYTVGSGRVEMKLSDMDNYVEIYNLLKKD